MLRPYYHIRLAGGTGPGTAFATGLSDLRYANTARKSSSVIIP